VAVAAKDRVDAGLAVQPIVTGTAFDTVVAGTSEDEIQSSGAIDEVVSATSVEVVVASETLDGVGRIGAIQCISCIVTEDDHATILPPGEARSCASWAGWRLDGTT